LKKEKESLRERAQQIEVQEKKLKEKLDRVQRLMET